MSISKHTIESISMNLNNFTNYFDLEIPLDVEPIYTTLDWPSFTNPPVERIVGIIKSSIKHKVGARKVFSYIVTEDKDLKDYNKIGIKVTAEVGFD